MRRRRALGLLLAPAIRPPVVRAGARRKIVTTIAQLAEVVARLAGEGTDVRALMGEGVDPHAYRPTRADILTLRRADLILANGLYLEAQLDRFLSELGRERPVVRLAERLPRGRLLENAGFAGRFDPHVWMEVDLWRTVALLVRDELIRLDPAGEAATRERAAIFDSELAALERYVRDVLASIPAAQRLVVTAHDAFNYFGRAYDLDVIGIQGLSTESEAGLAQIEALVRLIVERRLAAVFVETSVAERNVEALVEGAAARGHRVRIGGRLFSDAMGAPGTYEGTYVGMMDHNATVIARALGGRAPARGMTGRLALVE